MQINRWKKIVGLIKMIKDANGRFDDYSISPKIRKILLHWCYELVECDLLLLLLLLLLLFCSYKNELLLV